MKKILTGTVIGLIVAAGASSYLGRTLTQQAFDQQISELKSTAPLYLLTLEKSRLEHSLLGGKASIELFFEPPSADMTPLFLVLESDLQYGPLLNTPQGWKLGIASGQSQLSVKGLSEEDAKELDALIGPYLMTANHHLDFGQQLLGDISTPALKIDQDGEQFSFDGVQASFTSQLDSGQTQGKLTLGGLNINTPQGTFNSVAAQGEFEYSDIRDIMATGHFDLTFPEINIRQPSTNVSLNGFGIRVEQAADNGMLNVSETIKVEQIIGPVPVTALSANFDLEQINPEGIELWTQMLGTSGNKDPVTGLPDISENQVRELISALFQQGLKFNQRYDIDAMDGHLLADLDIEYTGLADGLHLLDLQHPRPLLDAVNAKLLIETDQQIAMALPVASALPQYIEQGWVTQTVANDKTKLSLSAELINGQLTINGQPIALEQLLPEQLAIH